MASNPGTDKSHHDKVERCFNDGFKNPAEPSPIDDRHLTEDDFGGTSMIIATAATPVIAKMMTPVSVRRTNRANKNNSPRLAIGIRSTWTCFWAAAIFRRLN